MPEARITYCGQPAKVACDGRCSKAWGHNNRPRRMLSDDEDDFAYLADCELDDAPADPGTYEGGDGKPDGAWQFPNRWCVRECERSALSSPGAFDDPLPVPDFSRCVQNIQQENRR